MTKGRRSDGATASLTTSSVRIWPPIASRFLCSFLILCGPIGVIVGIALGQWILAAAWALFPLLGARLVGWVEITGDRLVHRRLMGESTAVRFSDVRDVGLGMHQVARIKWWYPEVETTNGDSLKFLMLKSLSGKETIARIEKIFGAAVATLPRGQDDDFASVTPSEDGEMQFFLSPGYDAYRRENAETQAVERLTDRPPEVGDDPTVTATDVERLLALCESGNEKANHVAPYDQPSDIEEAPEVFTPGPLTEPSVSRVRHLAVVREPLVPPPIPQMIPVVIEQPSLVEVPRPQIEQPARQFTSLFRRAA